MMWELLNRLQRIIGTLMWEYLNIPNILPNVSGSLNRGNENLTLRILPIVEVAVVEVIIVV